MKVAAPVDEIRYAPMVVLIGRSLRGWQPVQWVNGVLMRIWNELSCDGKMRIFDPT